MNGIINMNEKKVKILFVCMGNICRSPTAHGVFETLLATQNLDDVISVDSAGTHAYHVGEQPDSRAQSVALNRGVDLSSQRARKVMQDDFERFDYVIAMDRSNHADLCELASPEQRKKIHLFMDFAKDRDEREVPDPYYGGSHGFERVLDMVSDASEGLLEDILQRNF